MMTLGPGRPRPVAARPRDDRGAGIVEYVLLILAVALVVLGAMSLFGDVLFNTFGNIAADVANAG